ncbi:MAG: hypothetical protein KGJ66_02785 [Alphaproteobacteria bacterium]|nr:hypothetical protein [Alphaproteobacteria bacterium]
MTFISLGVIFSRLVFTFIAARGTGCKPITPRENGALNRSRSRELICLAMGLARKISVW